MYLKACYCVSVSVVVQKLHIKQETHTQPHFERSALHICGGFPYHQMWAETSVLRFPLLVCSGPNHPSRHPISFNQVDRIIRLSRSEWAVTFWADSSVAVGRICFGPNHLAPVSGTLLQWPWPQHRLPRLREVAALLSSSTLLGVVTQPTDSRLNENTLALVF